MKSLIAAGLLAVLAAVAAPSARAAGLDAFNAAVADATDGYRSGLFYLRTGNAGLAAIELGTASAAWREVENTFAASPPEAFAGDPEFVKTMRAIGDALDAGTEQADAGDPEAAQATLTPIRGMLFDMRRRNGVDVYGDCVTELNRQMDELYVWRHDPPELADPAQVAAVKAAGETYAEILQRCRGMAPSGHRAAEEFQRLYDGARQSVSTLGPAADSGDARIVINVLRELRSFDRMIFLRWG